MQPFDIIEYDFRVPCGRPAICGNGLQLRVAQWNIERGYRLDNVISLLSELDADIICLQELDVGCARSNFRDCAKEIATALRMKCAFVVEFIELDSPHRSAPLASGPDGCHGNAILSRYEFTPAALVHSAREFDWDTRGHELNEPRRGNRVTLMADFTNLRVYCAHLEVFASVQGRMRQLNEILACAKASKLQVPHQIICGDLNTLVHGIARLSMRFCSGAARVTTIGASEAMNMTLKLLADCQRNPGFTDPWDPDAGATLDAYAGLYRGKLDWVLSMGMVCDSHTMANTRLAHSDHRCLVALLSFPESAAASSSAFTDFISRRVPCYARRVRRYRASVALGAAGAASALIAAILLWYKQK